MKEKKPVTEKIVKLREHVVIRIWIDVSDLIPLARAEAEIAQRTDQVTRLFIAFIQGTSSTLDALRAIRSKLTTSSVENVVNAFEVTDALGSGFVHYTDWP